MTAFDQALKLAHEAAREQMGEEITIEGVTFRGVVQAPQVQGGRLAMGGVSDGIDAVIMINRQDWIAHHHLKQGARVKFRDLEGQVMQIVPCRGDRIELHVESMNQRATFPGL